MSAETDEITRRNELVVQAVISRTVAERAIKRLQNIKKPTPLWLVASLNQIHDHLDSTIIDLCAWRDLAIEEEKSEGK